jgi:hypothetical protein
VIKALVEFAADKLRWDNLLWMTDYSTVDTVFALSLDRYALIHFLYFLKSCRVGTLGGYTGFFILSADIKRNGVFQMKNKQVFMGLGLVMSIMLFGCATVATFNAALNGIETDTSKMLFAAANEVLLSRESGWSYDTCKAAYASKVDGLRVSMISPSSIRELSLTYQERKYTLFLSGRYDESPDAFLTAAQKCVDVTKE